MALKSRDTQTRVKHEILEHYLDAWSHIIVNGLKSAKHQREWHFVYVDCFSYIGRYSGEKEDAVKHISTQEVYGSPIIGIKALEKLVEYSKKIGVSVKVNSILVEKNKSNYLGLRETLRLANYEKDVVETRNFNSLKHGQVAIVNEDVLSVIEDLIAFTAHPEIWAFYLIDPFGPSGIPFDFVKKVVSQDHHDVMINLIYEDFVRKAGMALNDELGPVHKQLVQNWTDAFGNDDWKNITRKILAEEENSRELREALGEYGEGIVPSKDDLKELKEQMFVSAYRDVLYSMDPSLTVKLVNLRFGDKERTMFYLYLTTHDPTGALELNKILYEAKYLEHELRHRLSFAKKIAPPENQPFLLPPEDAQTPEMIRAPRPSPEAIGDFIFSKFSAKQVTRKEVYKALANEEFFPTEVDKALRLLRKNKKAEFDDPLRHRTKIEFKQ